MIRCDKCNRKLSPHEDQRRNHVCNGCATCGKPTPGRSCSEVCHEAWLGKGRTPAAQAGVPECFQCAAPIGYRRGIRKVQAGLLFCSERCIDLREQGVMTERVRRANREQAKPPPPFTSGAAAFGQSVERLLGAKKHTDDNWLDRLRHDDPDRGIFTPTDPRTCQHKGGLTWTQTAEWSRCDA